MDALHKKLKKGQFAPVYVLYGTEAYRIQESLQTILTYALAAEDREFNTVTYDLDESYLEDVVEDARTVPFFGERKVLVVRSPYFLTSQKEKLEQNVKVLETYLEETIPFSIVIFIVNAEKLDERKKITKLLKKKAEFIEANPLQIQDVRKWIQQTAEAQQVEIEASGIELLVEFVGNNVMMLAQEMHKLCLYVGAGGVITKQLVTELVPKSVEQNVFTLVEKVMKKNIAGAMRLLHELLVQQEEPIKILALLASQFRLLYQVKELQQHGYAQNQMATHLGVHPYRVKLAMNQTASFSFAQLRAIMSQLADADYDMKTGKMDKRLVLEFFLMRLQ